MSVSHIVLEAMPTERLSCYECLQCVITETEASVL